MNGPEGFLPKKQNSMMQVVQVMWFRPLPIISVFEFYKMFPKTLYTEYLDHGHGTLDMYTEYLDYGTLDICTQDI